MPNVDNPMHGGMAEKPAVPGVNGYNLGKMARGLPQSHGVEMKADRMEERLVKQKSGFVG
jgi:hypothetical protein